MAAFKYRGRNRKVEDVVRSSKESSGGYDNYLTPGTSRFKAREGDNQIRIMPSPDFGDTEKGVIRQKKYHAKWGTGWHIMALLHRNVGPDETTYLCPTMNGEPCAVCEARTEADSKEADELRLQKRPFCWVIDRNNEKAGPLLWDMPMGVYRDINGRSLDKKTGELLLIDDPEDGFDVMFTREGTDKRTKYTQVEVDRDPSPLHENERKMERWLDYINANPIPGVLNFFDADHIEKVLHGQAERKRAGDDDEEEEEAPRKRRRPAADEEDEEEAPRKKRKPADEDEEEEEAPRRKRKPADEDEEEEEAPRRKRKPADEDEEEEEPPRRKRKRDEEEEEEEEAPRRKRKPADEDEEEEDPPRRKRKPADDEEEEEEEPPRKKRKPADEEEEEEEEAPRRRKPARDEEEEEPEGEEEEEDETPSRAAKRKLARLKKKSRK